MGWKRQPVFPTHLTAVAFVANNRILAAKAIIAFQIRAFEQPVFGTMHDKGCRAVHELSMAAMVAAPEESNSRELVFRPTD